MANGNAFQYLGEDLESMSAARNYYGWILKAISPFLGKKMAEVGAGNGHFSRCLLEANPDQLCVFEPSAKMFDLLKTAVGSDPRVTAVHGVLQKESAGVPFDSVIYINVLEHIEDDASELRTAFLALKPGGFLIVFVPALKGLYSDFDRQVGHVRRYSMKELKRLVERSGFSIVKARHFDMAGIVPWYIHFVLCKRAMSGTCVAWYDKLIVPFIRTLEDWLPPWIGKNIVLAAQKPPEGC